MLDLSLQVGEVSLHLISPDTRRVGGKTNQGGLVSALLNDRELFSDGTWGREFHG